MQSNAPAQKERKVKGNINSFSTGATIRTTANYGGNGGNSYIVADCDGRCKIKTHSLSFSSGRHDVLLSASALGGDSYLLKIDQSAQSILGLRVLPDVDGEFVNNYPTLLSDSGSNNRCLGHSTRLGGIDSVIELEYKSVGGVPKFDVILMSNSLQYSRETVAVE